MECGIQQVALATEDIIKSLKAVREAGVSMLDIEPSYYEEAVRRVPKVTEDSETIMKLGVLVDGDPEGYLLQIFTRNAIGPIFFEIIQR
ncbi:MAG: 4-hydroxyphenylpyruvate dioxygenase, partial [Bdellovibrionales bacterium]|nr:4-hydroxyphenylpyruvate dioxygenase [Bdellovibrionales bacterium]